ncbi:MAG: hypothetical protein QNJ72_08575 [Pleurocapsa sp. MO_226.B13]|nr:hypothetical protein [Pleurocapsa sp. MO_226.B13]
MMIDKKPAKTTQQQNLKQLPQLTPLELEQLKGVAGSSHTSPPLCPSCQED